MLNEKNIKIKIELSESGHFFATSPEPTLRGLLVAEKTLDALYEHIPIAISALCQAVGQDMPESAIKVARVTDATQEVFESYVTVPENLRTKMILNG